MPYSDTELETMLVDLEADWVERKESWSGDVAEKSRRAICAFANDLPDRRREGVLFVGARDSGTASGLEVTDQLLTTLGAIQSDGKISPPPSLTVEKRRLRGHDFAVVQVRPSDSPPVRYDGRIWIRVGPRQAIASAQEERVLTEKRRAGTRPFDVQCCEGAALNDLDHRFFDESYLPSSIARDVLEENGRTSEEQMASLKFLRSADDPTPTHLGILVAGKSPLDFIPGAYVQFVRVAGNDITDSIVDEATISGRLDEIIRRIEEKFSAHNSVAVDFTSRDREQREWAYPPVAFQQLFRNAVMHRTYENTNSPVRVTWFADRLEIVSPGGPFGTVTVDNFGDAGVTDYRNPNIAEAMKNLGFVQRFGFGIAQARKALAENGNPQLGFEVNQSFALMRMSQ